MCCSKAILLFIILTGLLPELAKAQSDPNSLQPGVPIERTIARGQSHSFTVSMEKDQVLQLVVDQRGIDVVVRLFSPEGKSLGVFDTPNGNEGPENVSLTADASGVYRIEVSPLGQTENMAPGRYEIKILELRRATEQELEASKNRQTMKARGLALVVEASEKLSELRLPQTRVRAQLQTARLLWGSDEKRAAKLIADAMDGIKEYLGNVDLADQDYYQ